MWEFYFYSALYRTQANENNSFAFCFICFPEYSTLMIFEINGFPFSALLGLVLLCSPLKGNHRKMDRCSHWHPPDSLVRWWELLYSLILVATVLSSEKKRHDQNTFAWAFAPACWPAVGRWDKLQQRSQAMKRLTCKATYLEAQLRSQVSLGKERRNSSILFTYLLPLQISIRWRETLKMVAMWAPYIFFD